VVPDLINRTKLKQAACSASSQSCADGSNRLHTVSARRMSISSLSDFLMFFFISDLNLASIHAPRSGRNHPHCASDFKLSGRSLMCVDEALMAGGDSTWAAQGRPHHTHFLISFSSIRNTSVALAGIFGGEPRVP
jgi:hypothetical protein